MEDPDSPALVAGTVIAGKYRLERALASGGMGSIWVARHLALDEPVAIKLISVNAHRLADAETRLRREAKSAARLRSPHVVQLLDYGTDQGMPYLVMELLEGEHLGERIRRKGRLSLPTAAAVLRQVAEALRRAHNAGLVHRDLKPENIFLSKIDDEEIVKLLDFGIVKAFHGTLAGSSTQANSLLGSLNYMSPEQSAGAAEIDHRTDLWSLGIILFEALTGRQAFPGHAVIRVLVDIQSGPLPVPSRLVADLPQEIDTFFEKQVFQRDPAKRFPSARAMAAEFSAIVRSVTAPRPQHGAPGKDPDAPPISVHPLPPSHPMHYAETMRPPAPTEAADCPSPIPAPPRQLSAALASHGPDEEEPDSVDVVFSERSPEAKRIKTPAPPRLPAHPTPPPPTLAAAQQQRAEQAAPPGPNRFSEFLRTMLTAPARVKPAAPTKQVPSPRKLTSVRSRGGDPPPVSAGDGSGRSRGSRSGTLVEGRKPDDVSVVVSRRDPGERGAAHARPFPIRQAISRATSSPEPPLRRAVSREPPLRRPPPPEPPRRRPPPSEPPLRRLPPPEPPRRRLPPSEPPPRRAAPSEPPPRRIDVAKRDTGSLRLKARVGDLIDRGFSALRRGDREAARQCWQEALALEPDNRAVEVNLRKLDAQKPEPE